MITKIKKLNRLSICAIFTILICLCALCGYFVLSKYCFAFATEPKITSNQIEFRKKENKVIFKDNVKLTQNGNFILCDYALKDDTAKTVDISGNIKAYYLVDSTGTVELKTQFGKCKQDGSLYELWGNLHAVYTSTEMKKLEIFSDKVEINTELKKMTFMHNVVVNYEQTRAESDLTEYFYNDKKIVLVKNNDITPVVYYSDGYRVKSTADSITLLPEMKKATFIGKVYSELLSFSGRGREDVAPTEGGSQ
ncbi:MAG: hypothetical protein QME68_06025 [Elusimicrobiota bacterium]|nr:hypothetical protein [Elusimicrobiota bacterium]